MSTYLAFIGLSLLVITTPGPDTAVAIRSAMAGGLRGGVFTALGVSSGLAIWALAASAGIAALLVASEPLFVALKMIGAAYLVYLGAMSLWGAFRTPRQGAELLAKLRFAQSSRSERPRRRMSAFAAYRIGLISDIGNPKIAAFFTSLLPQFVPNAGRGGAGFFDFAWLGLAFAAITFVWLVFYSWGVARIGDVLRRPKIRRALDAVMGTILVALGLRLAAEQR